MNHTSTSLLFFPPLNPLLLNLGPYFVSLNREPPSYLYVSPLSLSAPYFLSNLEYLKREKTMEALRKSNREIEALLAQLKISRTNVLTLERPVNLAFEGPTQEIVIVLLPLDISRIEIGLGLPKLMIRDH